MRIRLEAKRAAKKSPNSLPFTKKHMLSKTKKRHNNRLDLMQLLFCKRRFCPGLHSWLKITWLKWVKPTWIQISLKYSQCSFKFQFNRDSMIFVIFIVHWQFPMTFSACSSTFCLLEWSPLVCTLVAIHWAIFLSDLACFGFFF